MTRCSTRRSPVRHRPRPGGGNVASSYDHANVAYTRPGLPSRPASSRRPRAPPAASSPKRLQDQGQVHGHHGRGDQPLVPQRPRLPLDRQNLLHTCGCVARPVVAGRTTWAREKLRPQAGWAPIAFGLDWHRPPRHMNSTSFWYFHTDQWRYETVDADELLSPAGPLPQQRVPRSPTTTSTGVLVAVRPALQPQPDRTGRRSRACGATDEASVPGTWSSSSSPAPFDVPSPTRMPGKLAAQPDRVARQPDRHRRPKGPRVLPSSTCWAPRTA